MTGKSTLSARTLSRHLSLVLLLLSLTVTAFAQDKTVQGTVKDTKGQPVIGASIVVPGTTTGTTSDVQGNYTIKVPAGTKTLQFSYIGMENLTLEIKGDRLDAVLKDASLAMDEVVVIGYGTQRKSDLTGSIASVSEKVLASMPVTSTAQAITGRMAGVQITTTEGSPDAEVKIRVRGGGSVTQDNSPLYVVDGFPVSSISDIAPSDIASIDVLKDASSTAIYGARGANGVVIITTKSGKEGKVQVNFNAYWGVKEITRTLDVLDPYEYVFWQYEIAKRGGEGTSSEPSQSVRTFQKYYGVFEDMELYKSKQGTNWQDEVFGRSAFQQYYNLGVTGGGKSLRYNIGLTRNAEDGIMLGSGFTRNNITAKLNGDISKKFSFDFNTRFSHTVVDGAGTSTSGSSSNSRLKHTIKYAPVDGLVNFDVTDDNDETETNPSIYYNPVMVTNDDYKQVKRLLQTYNAAVNYKPVKWLTFRSEWGAEFGNERTDRYYGPTTSNARNYMGLPIAEIDTKETQRLRTANTLTFDKKDLFGDGHNLTVLLGQEASTYFYKTVEDESRYFAAGTTIESALSMMELGTPQPTRTFIGPDDNLLSFFGRINYSGKGRYLATFTMRADGSSKFAKGNRWGYFPSAAVAWRISDEKFMASTRQWLDNLKLRLSYGMAGNNRITDNLWRMLYTTDVPSNKYYYINGIQQNQLIPDPNSGLSNPALKWETTITRNIGIDVSLFNGRLNATADFYWNTTKDLLLEANIPSNTGFSYQMQNIGKTSNKGIELTLDGTIVDTKDFMLTASFNISFNRNKIEELGQTKSFTASSYWFSSGKTPDADYLIEEGRPIGQIYGYVTDGMYAFSDFTYTDGKWVLNPGVPDNHGVAGQSDFAPGALKFKKIGSDGSSTITAANDRTVIGDTNPKHTGGFSLNATWKNFDFSAFFNWVYGNDIYNANKLEFTTYPDTKLYGNILSIMSSSNRFSYVDRTTGKSLLNDPEALQAYNRNATIWSPVMTGTPVHSWAVEDGSFLRLNNITLGYTLPSHITKKVSIERLRVYVTGYNLYTWTNYTGYDPEVDSRRATPLTPGVDYSAFPRTRSWVAGINITF